MSLHPENPSPEYLDALANPQYNCRFCSNKSSFSNEICDVCFRAAIDKLMGAASNAIKTLHTFEAVGV